MRRRMQTHEARKEAQLILMNCRVPSHRASISSVAAIIDRETCSRELRCLRAAYAELLDVSEKLLAFAEEDDFGRPVTSPCVEEARIVLAAARTNV